MDGFTCTKADIRLCDYLTPQASGCQPVVWGSGGGLQRGSLSETPVAGRQLPDRDPSDGPGLPALPAGYDASPQPDHTHSWLCIHQPLRPCRTVSDILVCLLNALLSLGFSAYQRNDLFCWLRTGRWWLQRGKKKVFWGGNLCFV